MSAHFALLATYFCEGLLVFKLIYTEICVYLSSHRDLMTFNVKAAQRMYNV